jgi:CRP/FNR family transcriptional regulator, cyclic AMP receptor protein
MMNLFHNDASAMPFAPGETIFRAGEASHGQMYAVGEGEVEIQLHGQTLETVGPGGVFGEMGLIDNQARSADAVAKTAAKVVPINERRFAFLVQNNPYFPLHVMRTMTERIRRLSRQL